MEEGSLPRVCMTLVLTYTNAPESWDVLKEATLESLEDMPSDAPCLLTQATKLANWPKTIFQEFPHEGEKLVIASLLLADRLYKAKVYSLEGDSRYAHQVAAYELLKGVTEHRTTSTRNLRDEGLKGSHRPSKLVGKSPISILYEYCQTKSIDSPIFDYRLYGTSPQVRVTCQASFQGQSFVESSKSKQGAKVATCLKILQYLRLA
jgi:hypothetical protein